MSQTKCEAVDALPPFPHTKTLPENPDRLPHLLQVDSIDGLHNFRSVKR
jgi:hypothetical protein